MTEARSRRPMPGHRRAVVAFLLALATVTATGCSAAPSSEDPAGGDDAVVDPTEIVTEGEDTDGEDTEEGGPPPEEEAATAEEPAEGGDGRVSIELAGLPVGGNEVFDVDGTWCQASSGTLCPPRSGSRSTRCRSESRAAPC